MFDSAFLDLMPLTVSVNRAVPGQYDRVGNPLMSPNQADYRARAELGQFRVVSSTGEIVTARNAVIVAAQELFTIDDRITLPAGLNPQGKKIAAVDPNYDEDGLHHIEIYF